MENNKEIYFTSTMMVILFSWMSTWAKMPVKDEPNCFPDYRPGFKCFVFEKLP
jgi:hypothetical protein